VDRPSAARCRSGDSCKALDLFRLSEVVRTLDLFLYKMESVRELIRFFLLSLSVVELIRISSLRSRPETGPPQLSAPPETFFTPLRPEAEVTLADIAANILERERTCTPVPRS